MKNLKNAFWTSLILSFVVTIASSVLPRILWKSSYSASLVEGLKISAIVFVGIFILAFICTIISSLYREHKEKKEEELRKQKMNYRGYKKNKRK